MKPEEIEVLLLCNYLPDGQQSMLRFGELMARLLPERGYQVECLRPRVCAFPSRPRGAGGLGKWIGYIDKYILFPRQVTRRLRNLRPGRSIVHIVDHSNALYVPRRSSGVPSVVTCHDLLAVRGARGEDTGCPASPFGRRLQQWIVNGLSRTHGISCDSTSTLRDVERLVPADASQIRRVIMLAQNHCYQPVSRELASPLLAGIPGIPWQEPFLLHVGSNLARKNKEGIVRVLARLGDRWRGNAIFCGAELSPQLEALAQTLGVRRRIFAVPRPDNSQLEAIYSVAHAFLFPSACEGFGWPLIEAQACGCPVICSDRTSLPEIGGEGALTFAVEDEGGMAEAVLKLAQPAFRAERIQRGFENLARFTDEQMLDAFGELYRQVLCGRTAATPTLVTC